MTNLFVCQSEPAFISFMTAVVLLQGIPKDEVYIYEVYIYEVYQYIYIYMKYIRVYHHFRHSPLQVVQTCPQ